MWKGRQVINRTDLGTAALGAVESPLSNLRAALFHLLLREVVDGGHCGGQGVPPKSTMKEA